MKIKICGITNLEDAKMCLEQGADTLGFNFYQQSPRYVEVAQAQAIVRALPANIWTVGVFVNHQQNEVEQIARQVALNTLQFHGDETPDFCASFNEWRVIKAIRVGGPQKFEDFLNITEHLMLDSFDEKNYGGTGKEIPAEELTRLKEANILQNSFLSGGLKPENVAQKIKVYQPFGVDVASGVEDVPGKKSENLVRDFIRAAKGVR